MLDELIQERRKKLSRLKEAGIDPYPARVARTHSIADVIKKFDSIPPKQFYDAEDRVSVSGRIMSIRDQGKIVFVDLVDESGKIQVVASGRLGEKKWELLKSVLDIGDFISVTGLLFKTEKKEEKSIDTEDFQIAAKSLLPLPDKWGGLENEEMRLRKRYLDILMNPETKELFRKKTIFWQGFRDFLIKEGFLEVETPVLEALPGGAEAEPFKTHHNALDIDFYLRISLELPLKKLLVAGYEKVFEIGRIFRNEGIDREHLQDYTQLEFYWAYRDYNDLMALVERMYKDVIKKTCGKLATVYQGQEINWDGKWQKIDYVQIFKEETKLDPVHARKEDLISFFRGYLSKEKTSDELLTETVLGKGRVIDLIFKKAIRPNLIQPCFLVNPPVEIEPLAKRLEENPAVVERMQIIACGTELGKGFSELNDPIDQRTRFEEQTQLRAEGDTEAMMLDEDFLEALEYGMPPAAGFGVSERLFAVLMDKPIRETTVFPLMRPKE